MEEPLDLIRTTHEIDRGLAEIAAAVSDPHLKEEILAFESRWRALGFAVTAELCGVEVNGPPAPKRRGRPRRTDPTAPVAGEQGTDPGAGA